MLGREDFFQSGKGGFVAWFFLVGDHQVVGGELLDLLLGEESREDLKVLRGDRSLQRVIGAGAESEGCVGYDVLVRGIVRVGDLGGDAVEINGEVVFVFGTIVSDHDVVPLFG